VSKRPSTDSSFLARDTVMGRVVSDVLIGHHAFEM
jgi:hypothetical protein